jgi:hypothetical protein
MNTNTLPYLGLLAVLFSHWDRDAFVKTVAIADDIVNRVHGGDLEKARAGIQDMAYGNVSLRCRAIYQPVSAIIEARQKGFA